MNVSVTNLFDYAARHLNFHIMLSDLLNAGVTAVF